MRKLPSGWQILIWGILGFLMALSGMASGNVVTIIVGATLAFAGTSAYLTSQVKSERRVKKASEVVLMLLTLGTVVFGYVITRSLVLGVIMLFVVTMIFFAFAVSYFLPRIRGTSKSLARVKDMKGKDDLAYNAGTELGMEMRRRLEENWRSFVIAGVISLGCGLLLVSLKSAWFIVGLSVFVSYGIAYYSLSKLLHMHRHTV